MWWVEISKTDLDLGSLKSSQAKALLSVWKGQESSLFMRHISGKGISFNNANIFRVWGKQVRMLNLYWNSKQINHGIKSGEMHSLICMCVCVWVCIIYNIIHCMLVEAQGILKKKMQLRIISKVKKSLF